MRLRRMKKKEDILDLVWFFLGKYKLHFLFLIGLSIFVGIIESLNIALMYPIVANSLNTAVTQNPFLSFLDVFASFIPIGDKLIVYTILFIMLAIMVFAGKLIYFYLSAKLTAVIVIDTKQKVFNKCMDSDYQFFIDNKQGDIIYKTSVAPANVAGLLIILSNIFIELCLSVSIFFLLFSMSWKLTIFIVIGGILYYYLTKHLGLKISYLAGRKELEYGQKETVVINEYTTGVKQIKVFETFPYWKDIYNKTLHTYWKYKTKGTYWYRIPEVLLVMLLFISIGAGIIFIKLNYPETFENTIPVVGTFAFAVFLVLPKIQNFGSYRMQLMQMLPNVEAVFELLKDTTYSKIKNGDKIFAGLSSGIELRNVKFTHKERAPILNNVNMTIEKNKITALVGPSGSGKSTVVNLILRLFDVDGGNIYIDNVDIKEYDIYTFLRRIGFVSQETFIYNASIKENISFGGNHSDEEVIEAAKLADIHDFIQKLPEGYETVVGDRGMKLSGGEKQRLAIARAIIRKPEILILDEATSSLDNISENSVQKAINKVSKNCTTFVIAHRLSTIKNADIIYVIDNGTIIESGNHGELLKRKNRYWELYNIRNE